MSDKQFAQGQEFKDSDPVLVALLVRMADRLDAQLELNNEHHEQNQAAIASNRELFKTAFPNSDLEGHKRAHEAQIEWAELRNDLVRKALEHSVSGGVLAGIGWIIYALWTVFKMELSAK